MQLNSIVQTPSPWPTRRLEPSRAEFTAASYAAEVKELRNVGSGSFGSAILVEVVATGELFVSKKISLEHMAPDEQTKASNEAALLKSLRHQNITEYLGSFVLGNMLHIVMEYCSGGTLQQAMARRERASESFEEEEVFDWFLQIGMALEFIHSKMKKTCSARSHGSPVTVQYFRTKFYTMTRFEC